MRLNIATDIIPIGEFKNKMSKWLKVTKDTGHPLIITQNGKPAADYIHAAFASLRASYLWMGWTEKREYRMTAPLAQLVEQLTLNKLPSVVYIALTDTKYR